MIIGVSKDRYNNKDEAKQCLDGRKARKWKKNATCWDMVDFTTSKELLEYFINGHCCCGIYQREREECYSKSDLNRQQYGFVKKEYPYIVYEGKEYMKNKFKDEIAYRGCNVVFIDIDGVIGCNDIKRVIYILQQYNLCPSFYYTTSSDDINFRRFRMAYIFPELISPDNYEYKRISTAIGEEIWKTLTICGITPCIDPASYNPIQLYFGNYGCKEYEDFNVYHNKQKYLSNNQIFPVVNNNHLIWDLGLTGFLVNNWNNPQNYENLLDYKRSQGDYSMIEYRYFTESNSTGNKRFIDGIEIYEFTQDIPNKLRFLSLGVDKNGKIIKLKNGMKRRFTLKNRCKLRRLMKPDVNHNELLYNMAVDLYYGCEYSDLDARNTLDNWKDFISTVMSMSYEELLEDWYDNYYDEECIRSFSFVNKENCNEGTNVKIAKILRWEKMIRIIDFTRTNKFNLERLANFGYNVSLDTIERIVKENSNKLPNENYFKSLVNPSLSAEENYNRLKKDNYRITRDIIKKIKKELKK